MAQFINFSVPALLSRMGCGKEASCDLRIRNDSALQQWSSEALLGACFFYFCLPYQQTSFFLVEPWATLVILLSKSPCFTLYGHHPDYFFSQSLWIQMLSLLQGYIKQNTFDPKSFTFIFLGYSEKYKGYKCFHSSTSKFFVSQHVFYGTTFPYNQSSHLYTTSSDHFYLSTFIDWVDPFVLLLQDSSPCDGSSTSPICASTSQHALRDIAKNVSSNSFLLDSSSQHEDIAKVDVENVVEPNETTVDLLPTDIQHVASDFIGSTHLMVTRARIGIHKANPKYAHFRQSTTIPAKP